MNPVALARAQAALQRQDYEKQVLSDGGGRGTSDYAACGPPSWDRASWEAFKAQFGRYPFSAEEKPPELLSAPAWVKELCGLRLNPAERNG